MPAAMHCCRACCQQVCRGNAHADGRPLRACLQAATESPLLWSPEEVEGLLKGSAVRAEAASRTALLHQQWQQLDAQHFQKDPATFTPGRPCAIAAVHLVRMQPV
jgi:hypothetical protein